MSVSKLLAILLLSVLAVPAFAAARGTTAWTCAAAEPNGTVTIDSGSNRHFVVLILQENNTATTISTFTVGGQARTETFTLKETAASTDTQFIASIWNEAAIAAMSGADVSYTDGDANSKVWCYATIVDADQTALGAYDDTSYTGDANTLDVDTASSAGDHVVVAMIANSANRDFAAWDTLTEQIDSSFALSTNFGIGEGDGGDTPTTVTGDGTNGEYTGVSLVFLNESGVAVNFTAGPSVAAAANGYTISGTLNGTGFSDLTAYAVAVAPADGAPTCTQIKAGQNDGGAAAILSASEIWTTDVGDNFALTAANKPARLDVHVCASDGTNDTSVTSFADEDRTARTGFAILELTSIAATSIFDLDSYFDPDVAASDVIEYEDDTNESVDCNVSFEADGDFVLTPVSAGDCDGRQTFEISYEDVSSATDGLFTSPAEGDFTTDDTVYVNNSAPVCSIETEDEIQTLDEDEAMTSQDVTLLGGCEDPETDALTCSVTSGTLPNGTSLGGTGNCTWSGTPDTEDEAGEALTFEVCDVASDCDTFDLTAYTINTWTVPNLDGRTASQAADDIVTAAPWRENDVGLTIAALVCGDSADNGLVIDQSPAASTEIAAFDTIEVDLGTNCLLNRGRVKSAIGLGIN